MTAEVGVKLVLDDHATAALEKIKGGFEKVGERANDVQREMSGMLKQAVAVAIGFQFDRGIESLKELGEGAFEAAAGAAKHQRELAGVLALTDKSGKNFEEASAEAGELREQLEQMGVSAGVSQASMIDAFTTIAERSGKSREAVLELTNQMANASKALPGGIEQMAGAFQQLETGIVRPRNAIVQMIKQTGTMGGSARDIAKGLSAMVQGGQVEKATKIAEMAIDKMAKKMKDAPPTFEGLVSSLKDVREQLFETMGKPMLGALIPELTNLKAWMLEHKKDIEEFAKTMGMKVGEWVKAASLKIQEGFKYIQSHAKEIEEAITQGAEMLMQAVRFIIAHKEEIAILYGAKTLAPVIGGIASGVQAGASAFGAVNAAGAAGGASGMLAAAGAALGPMAALTAAIAALGVAAWQGYKLYQEVEKDQAADNVARLEMAQRMGGDMQETFENWSAIDKVRQKGIDDAIEAGGEVAGDTFAKKFDEALGRSGLMEKKDTLDKEMLAGDSDGLVEAYNTAIKKNDEASLKYIGQLLDKSEDIRFAFSQAGEKLSGGVETMLTRVGRSTGETAEDIRLGVKMTAPTPGASKVIANFSGPITLKQDFRDQDPDRVAVVFRREMERSASNVIGSKT
jgi:hypothetical protein